MDSVPRDVTLPSLDTIQAAANKGWNVFRMDLKTAFLKAKPTIRLVTSFVRSLLKWDIHHTLERA